MWIAFPVQDLNFVQKVKMFCAGVYLLLVSEIKLSYSVEYPNNVM